MLCIKWLLAESRAALRLRLGATGATGNRHHARDPGKMVAVSVAGPPPGLPVAG